MEGGRHRRKAVDAAAVAVEPGRLKVELPDAEHFESAERVVAVLEQVVH